MKTMDEDRLLKRFEELLKPIQEDLGQVRQDLNGVKKNLGQVRQDLNQVREDLDGVKDTVEKRVLPPLIYVETTVKSYADRYVANQDHIGRLDKRLSTVEENLGILPPQELSIPATE